DDETGFEIERKIGGGVFNRIITVAANETTYADTGLAPNTPHAYRIRAVNANSSSCTYSNYAGESITIVTSVKENITQTPSSFALEQNYPNPFNPSTTIAFSLPRAEHVTLKVFDLLGKEIGTLVDEKLAAGHYEVHWNAGGVESGTYFYQLRAGEFAATKKLILMK
ncbi:MAG: T9SS type A sorting domain-containing protein, partial [bacterium]